MEYILSVILITLEYLSFINLGDIFLHRSSKVNLRIVGLTYILISFLLVNFLLYGNPAPKFVIMPAILAITYTVFYTDKTPLKVLLSLIAYLIFLAIDYIFMLLFFKAFNIDYNILVAVPAAYIAFSMSSALCSYAISYLVKKKSIHRSWDTFDKKYLFLSAAFPLFSFITILVLFYITISYNISSYWIIFDIFGIVIANIFIFAILDKLSLDSKIEHEKFVLEQQLKSETANLEAMKNIYARQRKLTHDFSNHMRAIYDLAQKEGSNPIMNYTHTLMSDISENISIINTNNSIIDAIINQKYYKAQRLGISMRFNINDLSSFPLSSNDCVTVLANALDNAIEASSKTFDKTIMVKLIDEKEITIISVINSSLPVTIKDNIVIRPERTSYLRGYGLTNVKNAMAKYNHIFVIHYEKGFFQFTIIVNK